MTLSYYHHAIYHLLLNDHLACHPCCPICQRLQLALNQGFQFACYPIYQVLMQAAQSLQFSWHHHYPTDQLEKVGLALRLQFSHASAWARIFQGLIQ